MISETKLLKEFSDTVKYALKLLSSHNLTIKSFTFLSAKSTKLLLFISFRKEGNEIYDILDSAG